MAGISRFALSVLLLILAAPAVLRAATGGADAFGYTWADSDEPGIAATVPLYAATDLRALGFVGDESVIRITLPTTIFPIGFPFYGQRYPDLWLSTNGWLSFVDPAGNAAQVPANVPAATAPNATVAFLWDDLTVDIAVPVDNAGPNAAGDGFTIQVRVAPPSTPTVVSQIYVTLYQTGAIELNYYGGVAATVSPRTVIGIENASGTIGLPYMASGAPLGGASFRSQYAVVFYPPPRLSCAGATPLSCPQPVTAFDNLLPVSTVTNYGCVGGDYNGNEKVFALNLARHSNLTLTLTNTDGRMRHLFLVEPGCNEVRGCIAGGATTIQKSYVPPGIYHLVVDGLTAADNGSFTLQVDCAPATTAMACGSTRNGDSTSGASLLTSWSCQPNLTGPERVYDVTVAGPATLRATLASPSSPDLRVLIADPAQFNPASPSCLVADPARATLWNAQSQTYFVAVDGAAAAAGSYDLTVECARDLSCPNPPSVIDITSGAPVAGDTTGGPRNVDAYYCAASSLGAAGVRGGYTGPEQVYEFTIAAPTVVSFLLAGASPDMHALILGDCYEGSCLAEGGCGESLAPGTYRLVVDGFAGAEGPYVITPVTFPVAPFNRYYECPECRNGCTPGQGVDRSAVWHYDSQAYCGTGCDFAMYAVVECGTELHLPLSDVETGHIQVFDVFEQSYVDLRARNIGAPAGCELNLSGTLLSWEDSGCTMIPCPQGGCGGGADCRTDGLVMDVNFTKTPAACGVYRLDFLNWGGFAWDLYANCSGNALPQFLIYDNLCSALASYKPFPEVGISGITVDAAQCPINVVGGTVNVRNIGCAAVAGMEVQIEQAPPDPANPRTITADVPAQATATVPWSYNLSSPTASLVFTVDPSNRIAECSESGGGPVACGASTVLPRVVPSFACACINQPPPSLGNTLRAIRGGAGNDNVNLTWAGALGLQLSVYRIFKDADRRVCAAAGQPFPSCPGTTRSLAGEVPASSTSFIDAGAVSQAPAMAYYQLVGVSCAGDLEGPY